MAEKIDVTVIRIMQIWKRGWTTQAGQNHSILVTNLLPEIFDMLRFHYNDEIIRQELKLIDSLRFVGAQVKAQFSTKF